MNPVGAAFASPGQEMAFSLPSEISLEKNGNLAWLRFCRPEQGNRLTPAMAEQLTSLCGAVADDDDIQILAIGSAGEVFCTGLAYPGSQKGAEAARTIRAEFGHLQCVEALAALTKPTVAVLSGDAIGIGLELALACDLRLSVDTARFGLTQVGDGLIPFCGGTQRLPRIVGQAKALELVLTGALIEAS